MPEKSQIMAIDSAPIAPECTPATRAVGGSLTIDGLERRTRAYRRYEAIRGAVLGDLGGEQNTSEIQRQLIRRFSTLALQLELMEAAALDGDKLDLDLFGRGAGHLRRIAEALGLGRVAKDVPSLSAYLASKAAAQVTDAGDQS
jgi:hypothetical protein